MTDSSHILSISYEACVAWKSLFNQKVKNSDIVLVFLIDSRM